MPLAAGNRVGAGSIMARHQRELERDCAGGEGGHALMDAGGGDALIDGLLRAAGSGPCLRSCR